MEHVGQALIRIWTSLTASSGGDREWNALRIETGHPLDVYAGVRVKDKTRGLLFECPIATAPTWRLRFDSEGLRLHDDRDSESGVRRIALSLERSDLESVYLIIAEDLVVSSRAASNVEDALSAIGSRLSAWQTCLKLRKDGFGQERMLGLYGELILLERLAGLVGLDRAIDAWTGPDRGLHDFEAGTFALEVKTSLGKHGAVRIGNLEQLDPVKFEELVLCRVVVVHDDAGISLSEQVSRIRDSAESIGPSVRRELDQHLLMNGYIDADLNVVQSDRFVVMALEPYKILDGFPRLTRENVDAEITAVEYRLDVSALVEYQMSTQELDVLLKKMAWAI